MVSLLRRLPDTEGGPSQAWTARSQTIFGITFTLKKLAIVALVVFLVIVVLSVSIAVPLSTETAGQVGHMRGGETSGGGDGVDEPVSSNCAQRFAAGHTNSGIYEIITPDKNKSDVYCDHGNQKNDSGWTMVFKSVSGVPLQQEGPSALWLSNSTLESSSSALPINTSSNSSHYKSRIVEQWQAFNHTQVRLSLYTNKTEVLRLVFNATGSNKTNWFSRDRLLSSPWTDIHSQPVNYFSITGEVSANNYNVRRTFYINSVHDTCPRDAGWMVLVELIPGVCDWENKAKPVFSVLYSGTDTRINWSTDPVPMANIMAIFLR